MSLIFRKLFQATHLQSKNYCNCNCVRRQWNGSW